MWLALVWPGTAIPYSSPCPWTRRTSCHKLGVRRLDRPYSRDRAGGTGTAPADQGGSGAWTGMPGRAVRAACEVARRLGIAAPDATVLRASFSVYVHLAPASIVARVAVLTPLLRDPIAPWLAREVAVARFLADRQLPVLRPVDPDVHEHDGLSVTLWEFAQVVEGNAGPRVCRAFIA